MNDKSARPGFGSLFGGGGGGGSGGPADGGGKSAKPLPTSARRCEAGHPMASGWTVCPYCTSLRNAAGRTRTGVAAPPTPSAAQGLGPTRINPPDDDIAAAAAPRRTRVNGAPDDYANDDGARRTRIDPLASGPADAAGGGAGSSDSSRRRTRVINTDEPNRPEVPRGDGRCLTGILVTFSGFPLGRLFEIREGRNFVGSGEGGMDGNRAADIRIPEDRVLSGVHFLVLCQGREQYIISDCLSTNGTRVDGTMINSVGIELLDGALIEAGTTLFTFQKIRQPVVGARAIEPDVKDEPAGEWQPDRQRRNEGNAG